MSKITFREKLGLAITLAFLVALALSYIIDSFLVIPHLEIPFKEYLEKDSDIVKETLNYALSDFIIITKYFSKRVRVIWSAPPQLTAEEYLKLNPLFYIVMLTVIPALLSDFTGGKRLRDYIIEYLKPLVIVTILFGMFNGLRVFGSIGYYFAFLTSVKYEYSPTTDEINSLAFYFLASNVTKWVILVGIIALLSFIPLLYVSRDSIAGFLLEFANLTLNGVFYFATYVLTIHLALTGSSLGVYIIAIASLIMPTVRLIMLRKKEIMK